MKTDANLHPFPIPTKIFHQKFVILPQFLTVFYVSKRILRELPLCSRIVTRLFLVIYYGYMVIKVALLFDEFNYLTVSR